MTGSILSCRTCGLFLHACDGGNSEVALAMPHVR